MADLIGSLPAHAADRLRTLRQRVADLHAVVPMFEERQQANAAQFEAAQRLKRLQAHVSEGGFHLPDDDPRVRDEQRNVKRLAAEAKRLNDRYEMRSQAWTTAGQTLAHCESWLRDGKPAGVVLRDHADEVPKLAKDEDVLTFVERHRRRVRELKADLHRIESAPFPSSHAKQKMRQTVEALAQRGAPSVSHLIEHDRDVEFATEDVSVPIMGNKESPLATVAVWQQANTLALFCWLHRDTLIARLDAEIASEADDASALSHDERQRRAAETQADLLPRSALNVRRCGWRWRRICCANFVPTPTRSRCLILRLSSQRQRWHRDCRGNTRSTYRCRSMKPRPSVLCCRMGV